ncbi:MAG: bifunctional hydroxymethylpyrimidine kinase/phosphomethylpyrimidine kinase [Deltaproteobacteria bacterium]|nr:bifunctional hydroxymethylpyrimidine kinase/phosphomethylpyrimidine kinase [Deltaproteobacteria bacterium]
MGKRDSTPVILAFGGLDPTGGAGILMDSRAAAAAGAHACAVASCLTVQTTAAFSRFAPIPREVLDDSLEAVDRAFRVRAVKVGMVGTRAAAEAILAFVSARRGVPVVVDPVLRSSSGSPLLAAAALPAYRLLLRRAAVITPNLPEAEKLLDRRIGSFAAAGDAAVLLSDLTGAAVVLKGGHFPWRGRRGTDLVALPGGPVTILPPVGSRRGDPHGTGCALASAIAARIAGGDAVVSAVAAAKTVLAKLADGAFASAEGRPTLFP